MHGAHAWVPAVPLHLSLPPLLPVCVCLQNHQLRLKVHELEVAAYNSDFAAQTALVRPLALAGVWRRQGGAAGPPSIQSAGACQQGMPSTHIHACTSM
jgi:hypothetical protein